MRNLEREIGAICRHVAMRVAEGTVAAHEASRPPICTRSSGRAASRAKSPCARACRASPTGLAWTPTGGDILFVEATRVARQRQADPHRPARRGDEGKRAGGAHAGQGARARRSASTRPLFEKSDIHIHVPAGAIPKDGPSAGVAMFIALVSLLTGRTAQQRHGDDRRDLAARSRAADRRRARTRCWRRRAPASPRCCCPRATKRTSRTCRRPRASSAFRLARPVDDAIAAALNPPGTREEAESSVAGETSPARRAARSA